MDILCMVTSQPGSGTATRGTANHSRGVKAVRELSLAIALYGLAGWIYVAICSLAAPDTLVLPLTHLVPWLREDTSGVISFILSFLGFLTYRVTKP
jgi:hypothetical protein